MTKLHLWSDILWQISAGKVYAYCPEHRTRLDIISARISHPMSQDSAVSAPHAALLCPQDEKQFAIPNNDFWTFQRHFLAAFEALNLKDAEIVDVDGYQIPIAKATPPVKDNDYWVETRINDTKRGKQLVVYAGKRGAHDKTQIFIDKTNDKITFDQNNIHPNDIFTRIVADFDSGKRAILEQGKL